MSTQDYLTKVSDVLKEFLVLVKSCYGPNSRLKVFDTGGHVIMTSSSGRLLNLIHAEEPVVKIIVSAVKKHIILNIDGGLFCLNLCVTLIQNSLMCDQNRMMIGKVYHNLHEILHDYFLRDNVEGVRKLDFSNLHDLIALTTSIMKPKSGCILNQYELNTVCKVLVGTFIKTFDASSGSSASDVQIIGVLGPEPTETKFIEGILFPADIETEVFDIPHEVKFVMVTTSLAGDHGEEDDVAYVAKHDAVMDDVIDDGVFRRILGLCDKWVEHGVSVVLCQKVVHWRVADYLRKRGVIVLQRLGLQTTQYVLKITGGTQVYSILQPPCDVDYSTLSYVRVVPYCGKLYYQLGVQDCTITSTLLVVNRTEESLAELEYVCRAALDCMRIAARHPQVVRGGGYFETHGAQYLRQQVQLRHFRLMQTHRCSRVQLHSITEQFCRSLEATVSQFTQNHQEHTQNLVEDFIRLSMGESEIETETNLVQNESESVDLLCIKLAALHTAVHTACGLIPIDAMYETQNSSKI